MTEPEANETDVRELRPLWDERDLSDRRAMLAEILAQVSIEAL